MFHLRTKTLLDYLEDRMHPGRRARVERHLSACKHCEGELDYLGQMTHALRPGKKDYARIFNQTPSDGSCPEPASLYRYYTHQLPPDQSKEVEGHVGCCEFCFHLLEGFSEEQAKSIQAAPAIGSRKPRKIFFPRTLPLQWMGLSGALATCALLVVILWNSASPLPFTFYLEGQRKYHVRSGNEFRLTPGEALYSGDKFRLHVKPDRPLFLYAFLYTSSGQAQVLFPARDVPMKNPLQEGLEVTIPPGGFWPLDQQTGTETLFLAASDKPRHDYEKIPRELLRKTAPHLTEAERQKAAETFLKDQFKTVESFTVNHK